jgi:hypothetical protein
VHTLEDLSDTEEARSIVDQALSDLDQARDAERLRLVEATAANAYWGAWARVLMRFARRDESRVPDHWRTFGGRSSPLTGSPRSAANPANALLNYLYAILEAEARIAALAVGLDPGIGVLHPDLRNRDSLACDFMQAIRPQVDRYVLQLLQSHPFDARDFFEPRQGVCRLMPPMTHILAETTPIWAKAVAPVAELVAKTLYDTPLSVPGSLAIAASTQTDGHRKRSASSRPLPTPLTQANRSEGRAEIRRQPRRSTKPEELQPRVRACRGCGVVLEATDRLYCDDCLPDRYEELAQTFKAAGPQFVAQLRAAGKDPAHGQAADVRRRQRRAQHHTEAAEWARAHEPVDDSEFRREILPHLQPVSLTALMDATDSRSAIVG